MFDVELVYEESYYPLKSKSIQLKLPIVPAVGDRVSVGGYIYTITERMVKNNYSDIKIVSDFTNRISEG